MKFFVFPPFLIGLVFRLPAELQDVYREFGIDLPSSQGRTDGEWKLPLSATYVVSPDGVIIYRFVNADYRKRAAVADILDAIDVHQRS